jgi:protein-S-isoprenylcysteine O-methyltransferase Ste14
MPASRLKIPPVVTGLILGGLMWATTRAAPDFGFTLPARRIGALTLALAGVGIALLGVISFRRARTTVNPLHPETASTLVVAGVYRLTRNPMYLGLLLLLLGWAAFLANTLAFVFPAVYVPLMNRLQILPEEKALAEKFGTGFTAYSSQVRRWL